MVFLKVTKSKSYYKRFQTKFRRRREGKTDYYARKRLVYNDKNKYNTPKYRLVVRFSNTKVLCQIVRSKIVGDEVLAVASSSELPKYGLSASVGLTNYAAAYATGLLVARRILTKFGLEKEYEGVAEVDGEPFVVEEEEQPYPFRALLDIGLKRASTGAKVFSAMKGAADGGVLVPHTEKRFVGYDSEAGEFDAGVLRHHIFGGHVADYMNMLKEDSNDKFNKRFSRYVKAGINSSDLEDIYATLHKNIRASPVLTPKDKSKYFKGERQRNKNNQLVPMVKRSLKQRKARINQVKANMTKAASSDSDG